MISISLIIVLKYSEYNYCFQLCQCFIFAQAQDWNTIEMLGLKQISLKCQIFVAETIQFAGMKFLYMNFYSCSNIF